MQISAIPEDAAVEPPSGVHLVRANNPGPLSLSGTNTWVLARKLGGPTIVIDPGPPLPEHLAAIHALGRPTAIVLTHQHPDHAEAAPSLASTFGVPVYAALPELTVDTAPLTESDVIDAGDWQVTVLVTPGHTIDSVCLQIMGALFTGDTLLGGSTTIVAPPTGSLADYFETMKRLAAFGDTPGFPGHGPAFSSVGAWARRNVEYRETRLAELARTYAHLAESSTPTVGEVAAATYGENGQAVAPHIEAMTDAQLTFLSHRGDIAGWKVARQPR